MRDIFLIVRPWITEKATALNAQGKYVFMVKPSATKNEVKKAVKDLYKVNATAVQIINTPARTKRFRGIRSQKAGLKKAIVTLKKGDKIDLAR